MRFDTYFHIMKLFIYCLTNASLFKFDISIQVPLSYIYKTSDMRNYRNQFGPRNKNLGIYFI